MTRYVRRLQNRRSPRQARRTGIPHRVHRLSTFTLSLAQGVHPGNALPETHALTALRRTVDADQRTSHYRFLGLPPLRTAREGGRKDPWPSYMLGGSEKAAGWQRWSWSIQVAIDA
jgi:hypothetical protein